MMTRPPAKFKNQWMAPEVIKIDGVPYAFSLNPDVSREVKVPDRAKMELMDGEAYAKKVTAKVMVLLKKLNYCKVDLRPELSRNGRWHYHGLIYITNIVQFLLEDIPLIEQCGSSEMDTIKDSDVWNHYVFKSHDFMQPWCKSRNIAYVLNNFDPQNKWLKYLEPNNGTIQAKPILKKHSATSDSAKSRTQPTGE